MKLQNLEYLLIQTTPIGNPIDTDFTERVMTALPQPSLLLHQHINRQSSQKKYRKIFIKLRHIPKFALIVAAVIALCTVSGVTYALVRTITAHTNVTIEKSGKDQFGHEQLSVAFDSCAEEKKIGTTYELQKNSDLSAIDGAKVLQARCELDSISSWLENDPATVSRSSTYSASFVLASEQAKILKSLDATSLTIQNGEQIPFPNNARIVANNKIVSRSSLKQGDNILYFSPLPRPNDLGDIVVFKLTLPAKYYNLDLQSYVRTRSACRGNPILKCLQESTINAVTLTVSHGGAWTSGRYQINPPKSLQGRVVSHDRSSLKIDTGDGVIYTIQTPSDVIETYNQTTVYGLKDLDTIYSHTNPDVLKVAPGDSLDVAYLESPDQSSRTIKWADMLGIGLMVERTTADISVLEKY